MCSKPLTYAIALNELGADVVHRYIGQEPSGRMFNELILDYNSKLTLAHIATLRKLDGFNASVHGYYVHYIYVIHRYLYM